MCVSVSVFGCFLISIFFESKLFLTSSGSVLAMIQAHVPQAHHHHRGSSMHDTNMTIYSDSHPLLLFFVLFYFGIISISCALCAYFFVAHQHTTLHISLYVIDITHN